MAEVGSVVLMVVIGLVMVAGLLSLIIPGMPGLVVIWVAALAYALLTDFQPWWVVAIYILLTLLMIGGNLLDNLLMGTSAAQKGAKWYVIVGVLIAGIIASIFTTPIGGILVTFGLFFAVEYTRLKDWRKAADSTGEMAKGWGKAVVARMAVGMIMIGLWAIVAAWG